MKHRARTRELLDPHGVRAIAVDYDGTLTTTSRPDAAVLAAIAEARSRHQRVVLVTGRILVDLRAAFPDVDQHFDAIVAENGAVLALGGSARPLAPPVDDELARALARLGIPLWRGQVLLATGAAYEGTVHREIARLRLELHLVRNRDALMVLPRHVSKGSGVAIALAELGISAREAVGIGDAENDCSLLDACGIGVAVANAVELLKARADIVLPEPDGAGVARLLGGLSGNPPLSAHPGRTRLAARSRNG